MKAFRIRSSGVHCILLAGMLSGVSFFFLGANMERNRAAPRDVAVPGLLNDANWLLGQTLTVGAVWLNCLILFGFFSGWDRRVKAAWVLASILTFNAGLSYAKGKLGTLVDHYFPAESQVLYMTDRSA